VEAGGTALPWGDQAAYTEMMLQRSIQAFLEHTPASKAMFSDRGIPDTLGYARLIGLPDTSAIESACRRYRYAPIVFVASPWQEIYETDSERKQDFAEAERTYQTVVEVYRVRLRNHRITAHNPVRQSPIHPCGYRNANVICCWA
jgi:predicted ATPase